MTLTEVGNSSQFNHLLTICFVFVCVCQRNCMDGLAAAKIFVRLQLMIISDKSVDYLFDLLRLRLQ